MESKISPRECFVCRKEALPLRCSACKQVIYCSKKCQKAHWKIHKKTCKKEDENANYKTIDFQALKSCIENSLGDVGFSVKMFESAKVKVQRLYPKMKVICNIDDLSPMPEYDAVFLAFISKFHPYSFRHAVYIQDISGKESFMTFYLDYDKPEPYFTWLDVRPGRFVVMLQPHIHQFLDGQIGLRIEEPHEVRFIEV